MKNNLTPEKQNLRERIISLYTDIAEKEFMKYKPSLNENDFDIMSNTINNDATDNIINSRIIYYCTGLDLAKDDIIIDTYKGFKIVNQKDFENVIQVVSPSQSRFIIDLDDSKRCGYRKSLGMSFNEQLKEAYNHIDRDFENNYDNVKEWVILTEENTKRKV